MAKRNWSVEEVEYLQDKWGVTSIKGIAKKLNRTVIAVKSKAQKLGLGRFLEQGEFITFNQLTKAIGYGGSYVHLEKRLKKLDFPIKEKTNINKPCKIVYLVDFWKWTEQHKQALNFAAFEKNALGKEPEWVEDKRQADSKNPSKLNHNRKWSKAEDNLLIELTKTCRYTYKNLSKELNRTENAIKRRLYDLKVPYRPVPLNNHEKWTAEENRRMLELHEKGYDTFTIARELNKSNLSIGDRLKKDNLLL